MPVYAVVCLELFATLLADKHMATVLPNFVLVSRSQRLDSLVTSITGVNPLILVCFVPPLIPSSNNMNSLTNLLLISSGPGVSR